VTFNSWDCRITNMLPLELALEFPVELSHRNAISSEVFQLMRTCFNYGVGSKQFSHILRILHRCRFSQLHIQYLEGIIARSKSTVLCDDPTLTYEAFSGFADSHGYGGFIPSSSWLCKMYDKFIEWHSPEIHQYMSVLMAEVCRIDHSHKVSSHS
jgi:hypothetical protein